MAEEAGDGGGSGRGVTCGEAESHVRDLFAGAERKMDYTWQLINTKLDALGTRLDKLTGDEGADQQEQTRKRHKVHVSRSNSVSASEGQPQAVVFGSINVDLLAELPEFPQRNSNRPCQAFETLPGGKGANAAVALARLGIATSMVARVGPDEFSDIALRSLRLNNVDVTHVKKTANEDTGVALVVSAKKQGKITVTHAAANFSVDKRDVEDVVSLAESTENRPVVIVQLEVRHDIVAQALEEVRRRRGDDAHIVVKASPLASDFDPDPISRIMKCANTLIVNEWEAPALLGWSKNKSLSTVPACYKAAKEIHARYGTSIVLVCTPFGIVGLEDGETVHAVPTIPVRIVSIIGAADALSAGFVAARVEDRTVPEALVWAVCCAAVCIKERGAQESPKKADLFAFMERRNIGYNEDPSTATNPWPTETSRAFQDSLTQLLEGESVRVVRDTDFQGRSLLHAAAWIGSDEQVAALLQHNDVQWNAKDRYGNTPFACALTGRQMFKSLKERFESVLAMLSVEGLLQFLLLLPQPEHNDTSACPSPSREALLYILAHITSSSDWDFLERSLGETLVEQREYVQQQLASFILRTLIEGVHEASDVKTPLVLFIRKRLETVAHAAQSCEESWRSASDLFLCRDERGRHLLHAASYLADKQFLDVVTRVQMWTPSYAVQRSGSTSSIPRSPSSVDSLSSSRTDSDSPLHRTSTSYDAVENLERVFTKAHSDMTFLHFAAKSPEPRAVDTVLGIRRIKRHYTADRLQDEFKQVDAVRSVFSVARNLQHVRRAFREHAAIKSVFLSYKHGVCDDFAKRLHDDLERGGISCWWDREIQGGDEWQRAVEWQATHCNVLLCLLSKPYFQSEYCTNELDLNKNRLAIQPPHLKPEDRISPGQLPNGLKLQQLFDFRHSTEEEYQAKLRDLIARIRVRMNEDDASPVSSELPVAPPGTQNFVLLVNLVEGQFAARLQAFLQQKLAVNVVVSSCASGDQRLQKELSSENCRAAVVVLDLSRAQERSERDSVSFEQFSTRPTIFVPYMSCDQSPVSRYQYSNESSAFRSVVPMLGFVSGHFPDNPSLESAKNELITQLSTILKPQASGEEEAQPDGAVKQ